MSTVSLTIDYSNGMHKHFSNVSWTAGLTVLNAIEAVGKMSPGAAVNFASDRSGHAMNLVIDELPQEAAKAEWLIWVNAKPFKARLGTQTSFGFHPDERGANLLHANDHVLLKLSLIGE